MATDSMATDTSATARSTAVGVFQERSQAEAAIEELHRAGFRDDQVSFLLPGQDGEAGGTTTGAGATGATTERGSAAAADMVTGGLVGSLLGAAVALLIPGVGPIAAGGILATALGGAAAGAAAGAAIGGLVSALTSMAVPEEEALYYESEFQAGRALVTVQAGDRFAEARRILRGRGAHDVETRAGIPISAPMGATTAAVDTDRSADMAQHRAAAPENLSRQEAIVERDEAAEAQREAALLEPARAEAAELPGPFQSGTIRVPLRGEELVTTKEVVVRSEVVIRKTPATYREEITDTVRRSRVHVEEPRRGAGEARVVVRENPLPT